MKRYLWIYVMITAIWVLTSCSEDDGAPNETQTYGTISGTVTFVGTWPDKGDVQVSAWTSWPPAGPPAASSDVLTPGNATQSYKLEGLSLGSYPVITVGWRDPADPAGAVVLGIYHGDATEAGVDSLGNVTAQPLGIEVSKDHLTFTDINMTANLDVAP
ncbi:MAG: hypothetical protein D6677_03040 [Calditrichaeota bacterium]|nr:MAG: hypothetical protein D6677_03040 [Calditrichota bacterium]